MPKTWLETARDFFGGAAVKRDAGIGIIGAAITVPLGNGIKIEGGRKMDMYQLKILLDRIVSNPDYKKHDITGDGIDETFCNKALQETAIASGCYELAGLVANSVCDRADSSPNFSKETDVDKVIQHVMKGGFAFAGKRAYPNGHVASVYPLHAGFSGTWGRVPYVAHVGAPPNGIKGVNYAFPIAAGKPEYYLYKAAKA